VRAVYGAIAARFGNPTEPARPSTIVEADVCPLSGKRPGPHCDHHKRELFIAGHVPEETCDWHRVVCGVSAVVYPPELRAWAAAAGLPATPSCDAGDESRPLAITSPTDGAHFVLEPYRPAMAQRPPLVAVPADATLRWTIDDEPAERWVPSPGTHRIVASRGGQTDTVTITYE
jgi:penicillin-binding protein 1C